jgi:hypothetical protein
MRSGVPVVRCYRSKSPTTRSPVNDTPTAIAGLTRLTLSTIVRTRKRQVWVEPLFAGAKEWHGLRRLRLRGLLYANIQGLLIAAGQNLKRFLAASSWGRRFAPCGSLVALPREPWRPSRVSG